MTSEIGSFARRTIVERKPQIIGQVIRDNDYPDEILRGLDAFRQEIARHPLQPLPGRAADVAFWNREAAAYLGRTWLELPWYFAESYFYRRLLEAVRYFLPGPWLRRDPFGPQKRIQESEAVSSLALDLEALSGVGQDTAFEALLHSCLWGNRADLSNFTVQETARGGLAVSQERRNLLVDHTELVADLLSAGLDRVDFVNDNTGRELLSDLVLADFLLHQGWVGQITFHLKDRPFFVSDAMPEDVQEMLVLLGTEALGHHLTEHLAAGRLRLKSDPFWTSCLMLRQMPAALAADLAQANLIILKGDVNYRRLLEDRHWPHTEPIEKIADYLPTLFLVLRTLKGEIMVGLGLGQAEALAAEDPTWLINGKRGIIHLVGEVKHAKERTCP
jgi:uncharacterized protein with ATP-grasp and redox domains